MYPEWKSRVAKDFINNIMDILSSEDMGMDVKEKALELLANITGCDSRSANPNKEILEIAS